MGVKILYGGRCDICGTSFCGPKCLYRGFWVGRDCCTENILAMIDRKTENPVCLEDILTLAELTELPFPARPVYEEQMKHRSYSVRDLVMKHRREQDTVFDSFVADELSEMPFPARPEGEEQSIEAMASVKLADQHLRLLQDKHGEWPCLQFEDDNEMIFWSDYARAFAHGRASCSHDKPAPTQVWAESVEYADGMLLEERRRSNKLALARLREERVDSE